MTVPEDSYESYFHFKMDPKCRVAFPAEWRPDPKKVLRLMQATSYGVPVLKVLTEEEFENMVATVDEKVEWSTAKIRLMKGALFERCMKVSVNLQNKLLIPRAWCDEPELQPGQQVTLVGRGTYCEIFSAENYAKVKEAQQAELDELNKELGYF